MSIGVILPLFLTSVAAPNDLQRFEFTQVHMGGAARITVFAPSETQAEKAVTAAFQRIADLEQIMSDYRPTSEIRRAQDVAAVQPVVVSRELAEVLTLANRISRETNGAFDVTVGPLIGLWREARKTKQLPTELAIIDAKHLVGFQFVTVDRNRRVSISRSGVRIDLGGIAKGYAAQEAVRTMRKFGVRSSLVEMGGDIVAGDAPPKTAGWLVRIDGTEQSLTIKNTAVSTSGSTEQFVEIGGTRYSHIVDPKTGFGLTHLSQVTVVYPDGAITDPLATALCMDSSIDVAIKKKYRNLQIIRVQRS